MKKFTTPLFAVLCLFLLAGVAVAEAPEASPADTLDLDLLEVQSTSADDCNQAPTVALDGQDATFASSFMCGTCSPSASCVGKTSGSYCTHPISGLGTCNQYKGLQCSDGSGWDCACYASGEQIP